MSRLDDITERSKGLTPGPWKWKKGVLLGQDALGEEPLFILELEGSFDPDTLPETEEAERERNDLTFIAHAREDISWLITRLKKLEHEENAILDLKRELVEEKERNLQKLQELNGKVNHQRDVIAVLKGRERMDNV